ncbi:MAG TPA: hypothetical protein VMT42_01505 [candidate division Zixibacteria bacterium]|nr:hypothetical protein [candidate division Zixibacteria bacterium]
MSRIWEVLTNFKRFCTLRGWRTSENEDWVELNDDYHNFLSTKNVSPASFKAIITNRKCVVHKGLLYTVVEPSHLAWLFSEVPSQDIFSTVLRNPDFSRRIAIYYFSPMLEGKNTCIKLNNTDSPVFHEFETFLQSELKVTVESFQPFSDSKISLSSNALPQLA